MNNRIICLLILILASLGCTREDPHPELMDPIYLDLMKELGAAEHAHDEISKKIETAIVDLKNTEPRTIDRKNATRELQKLKVGEKKTEELIEFLKIRTERRKIEGTAQYKRAFAAKKPWPDKSEFEDYMTNKRLNMASRNWNERVPKTHSNIALPPGAEVKSKGGEGEGEAESKGE